MKREAIINGINVIITRGASGYDIDKVDGGIMAINTKLVSFGPGRSTLQAGYRSYKISDDDASAITSLIKDAPVDTPSAAPVKASRKHMEPCPRCGTYCSGDCYHN